MKPTSTEPRKVRRRPLVAEVASLAGVGTATVDRVLNARGQVAATTRMRVLDALARLQAPHPSTRRRIAFVCESGASFNRSLAEAVEAVAWRRQDLELSVLTFTSFEVQLVAVAQAIERAAEGAAGVVIVARADAAVERAARAVMRRGRSVVCLATDLPRACRHGFVGSDERAAGAAAASLLGDLLGPGGGRVLFIACGAYHASLSREVGFRAALAAEVPGLRIEDRLEVRNDPAVAYAAVRRLIEEKGGAGRDLQRRRRQLRGGAGTPGARARARGPVRGP